MKQTILASGSPRRRELLGLLGFEFSVVKPDVVEKNLDGESPEDYVLRNAAIKAEWVYKEHKDCHVIAADTVVVLGYEILEKPTSPIHAKQMLLSLSGQKHQVLTGFCVQNKNHQVVKYVETIVEFKSLTDSEIDNYVATDEPHDKAGSYAAQGVGSCFIKGIIGSYTNVVGLPMAQLIEVLQKDFNYSDVFTR